MSAIGQVLYFALLFFLFLLFFRIIMSYVFMFARDYQPKGVMVVLLEVTYSITDPPLKLIRRFIPPLRLGAVSLDLAFLVLFIIVYILISLTARL
ncbi:MAG TPA: YggT family protein [Actinomycetes bacterium]|nr:YggT family protein [Actinomycetes bacterium]